MNRYIVTNPDQLLSIQDVAQLAQRTETTVHNWIRLA